MASKAPPRKLPHHVDLADLALIVELKRLEVGPGKAASGLLLRQLDGHGLPEDRQAPMEVDDLLLVQPHQGALQQLLRPLTAF